MLKISAYIFLFLPFLSFSQGSARYPIRFSQFFLSYNILNPSSFSGRDDRLFIHGGQQFYSGPLSVIRTSYGLLHINIPWGEMKNHGAGLVFVSDKEGELLSYTRAYLHYAVYLPLSAEWGLSSGVRGGMVQFSAEETSSSRLLLSRAADLSAGLELSRKELKIGISGEQLLNSKFPADLEVLNLPGIFNFYASGNIALGSSLGLYTTGIIRLKPNSFPDGDAASCLIIKNILFAGLGYGTFRGLSLHIGVSNLGFLKGNFGGAFSYNSSVLGSTYISIQTFEVSLNYRFLTKKEG